MRLGRYALVLAVPVLLILGGAVGYHLIEGWSFFDALYMSVITLTTVGFGEVHPLSRHGREFTIALSLGGIFSFFYAATEAIRAIVTGEVGALFGRQRMERSLQQMRDHIIVCGYGRMGRFVCHEFAAAKIPVVVIERSEPALADVARTGAVGMVADATSDETLRRAGVDRARALVTVVASDADNLYITMSARFLNERLYIVARSEDESAAAKLERAGANRVISPYSIGGHRVAQAVLRPSVMDFIELATRSGHLELQIEETRIGSASALSGKTLDEARLGQALGVVVVVIRKPDGSMVVSPQGDARLAPDDILIALGRRDQLDQLEALARG